LVLVILAVIWAAVLVPPYLQNRSDSRPADSISTFRNQLSVLERRAGSAVPSHAAPVRLPQVTAIRLDRSRSARAEMRKRRRDILVTLLAAAGLTLVIGLVMTPVLYLHVLIDAMVGAYVALLIRQRRLAEERAAKVRYLGPTPAARRAVAEPAYGAPEPALALRRSANG
jgi:hypothetical protein